MGSAGISARMTIKHWRSNDDRIPLMAMGGVVFCYEPEVGAPNLPEICDGVKWKIRDRM